MYNYPIGFRLNFDDIKKEELYQYILKYVNKFNIYEIKVTNKIIATSQICNILKISEKLAKGKYSLHLEKKTLFDICAYNNTIKLIKILKNYKLSNSIFLITHIPNKCINEYFKNIINIANILPSNYTLLLENEKLKSSNVKYLYQINRLCNILVKEKINNVKICFDFGHFLSGCYNEGISEEFAFKKLQSMHKIIPMIKQIHIHDYYEKDHLQLNTGLMNINKVLSFIINNRLNVSIIIETTVKEAEYDGIKQIKLIEQHLKNILGENTNDNKADL